MSSVINLTTGECITGTCQAIESCEQFKIFFVFLICFALSFMVAGFILTWWTERNKGEKSK